MLLYTYCLQLHSNIWNIDIVIQFLNVTAMFNMDANFIFSRMLIILRMSRTILFSIMIYAEISIAIRLQGPFSANGTGRVEVFYREQWGTICDDYWDINDANVACRQLGYQYGVQALQEGDIRPGSGEIWLDDVDCTGSEKNLASCSHSGWGNHNCVHQEDAGVECLSTGKINYYPIHFDAYIITCIVKIL